MKRFLWLLPAALLLNACTSIPAPTFDTANAQSPVISRFGASPTSGNAPLLVRFFWSISDANRDLMSCELDVAYDGNFTADYSVGLPRTRTANCTSSSRINHTLGPGIHRVALRVCDGSSCTIREQTITARPSISNQPPVISSFVANPNPVGVNLPTSFSWVVSDLNLDPLTCTFDPDTATNGNEQVVPCNQAHNHTYTSTGNFTAQLSVSDGRGGNAHRTTPVSVVLAFSQISGGTLHTCALTTTDKAYCWGDNFFFQHGNDSSFPANTPQAVTMPTDVGFTQLSSGYAYACALGSDGITYCWGRNEYGQLGNGNTGTDARTPQAVTMPTGVTFTQVSAGENHTCALGSNNQAYCWGRNEFGQLGKGDNGDANNANTPQAVTMPVGVTFTQISAGKNHTCALGNNSQAYCWGRNDYGQLGYGSVGFDANVPQPVTMPSGVAFTQVIVGVQHACALSTTGSAYCWGWHEFGQLGNGSLNPFATPQAVSMPAGVVFTQVTAGTAHTCALATTGNAYCWGSNVFGELGKGDSVSGNFANTPQAVTMPTGVTFGQIRAGLFHTCAIAVNQTYCWGYNSIGQLGNGDNNSYNTPQPVVMP